MYVAVAKKVSVKRRFLSFKIFFFFFLVWKPNKNCTISVSCKCVLEETKYLITNKQTNKINVYLFCCCSIIGQFTIRAPPTVASEKWYFPNASWDKSMWRIRASCKLHTYSHVELVYMQEPNHIPFYWLQELFHWVVFNMKSHCLYVNQLGPLGPMKKLSTFFPWYIGKTEAIVGGARISNCPNSFLANLRTY